MITLSHPKILSNVSQHILSFSKLRHSPFVKFSDTFHHILANTPTPTARSVFIASPAVAHTKRFICWIDSGFLSVPFRKNYHKCSGTLRQRSDCIRSGKTFVQTRKMVWITDLDDPKVDIFFGVFADVSIFGNSRVLSGEKNP
jgi:hypothetical protein